MNWAKGGLFINELEFDDDPSTWVIQYPRWETHYPTVDGDGIRKTNPAMHYLHP